MTVPILESERETALLLIDLQNSFIHPDGRNFIERSRGVVESIRFLLNAARKPNRTVSFLADRHRLQHKDFERREFPTHCEASHLDEECYGELAPQGANEYLLQNRRMSGFNATDLDLLRRENNIQRFIVGAVKTNVCVRATVQDDFAFGYDCCVVNDAVGSNRPNPHQPSMEDIDRYIGWVLTVPDAMDMLS